MQLLPGELLKGSSTLGCRCFAEGQFPVQQETGKSLKPWRPKSVPKGSFPVLRAMQHWIRANQNHIRLQTDRDTLQQSQKWWVWVSRLQEVVFNAKAVPWKDTLLQDESICPWTALSSGFKKTQASYPTRGFFPFCLYFPTPVPKKKRATEHTCFHRKPQLQK